MCVLHLIPSQRRRRRRRRTSKGGRRDWTRREEREMKKGQSGEDGGKREGMGIKGKRWREQGLGKENKEEIR